MQPPTAPPELVGEASLAPPAAATRLGGTVVASAALHLGLLAAALFAIGASPPEASAPGDVVLVEIVSADLFQSDADSTVETSASLAMLAAGDPGVSTPPDPVAVAPPAEPVIPPPAPEILSQPVTRPLPQPEPEPAPLQATPLLVAPLPGDEPDPEPAPPAEPAEAPDTPPEPPKLDKPPVEPPPPKPATTAKPKETPEVAKPAARPKTTSGGTGGTADADSAASKASPARSGSAGSGSAAVSTYPGLVQKALRRALRYPKGAGRAGGEAHVSFTVSATGKVSGIHVVRSTGNATLDAEAVRTVERAAPFPAIPADAGRKSWTFTMPLLFKR